VVQNELHQRVSNLWHHD